MTYKYFIRQNASNCSLFGVVFITGQFTSYCAVSEPENRSDNSWGMGKSNSDSKVNFPNRADISGNSLKKSWLEGRGGRILRFGVGRK
jgi:hypothetical protein